MKKTPSADTLTSAHAQSNATSQTASDSPGSWKMVGAVSGTTGLMFARAATRASPSP